MFRISTSSKVFEINFIHGGNYKVNYQTYASAIAVLFNKINIDDDCTVNK